MTSLRSVNQSAAQAPPALDERQRMVLRALVTAYVADANPVGSTTISYLLPVRLSSASVRTTMSELADLGLISKSHASAGREPTSRGLRFFVDQLLPGRVDEKCGRFHHPELACPDHALQTGFHSHVERDEV